MTNQSVHQCEWSFAREQDHILPHNPKPESTRFRTRVPDMILTRKQWQLTALRAVEFATQLSLLAESELFLTFSKLC